MRPNDWVDKPITLSRKDFTAVSNKALWIRLPCLRFVNKIDVGFDRTRSRAFQVEVEKKELAIPLRDFSDAEEIENRQEESEFMIWIQPDGTETYEAIVAKITTESSPLLLLPIELSPQAFVKCYRGRRRGKSFSREEITEAGISMKAAKNLHIPYDKRRKSSHAWNVENLKYMSRR
jgi:hypothetical protein